MKITDLSDTPRRVKNISQLSGAERHMGGCCGRFSITTKDTDMLDADSSCADSSCTELPILRAGQRDQIQ